MANYIAAARSNYFAVTDRAAFDAAIARFGDLSVVENEYGEDKTLVGVLANEGDGAGWPLSYTNDEDESVEADLAAVIAEHLAPGHVAVLMEAGAEKLRYIHGNAVAINSDGERRSIDLREIYQLGRELGSHVTAVQY